MIQRINEVYTGAEYVCEVPAGWQAALFRNERGLGFVIVLVPESADSPPLICERGADGVWRQCRADV